MVAALVELEHRLAGLEVLARQQPGLLELRQHAVDGGEADVDAFGEQRLVDVLGREVAHLARLEQLEDLAPGQRRLEAAVLQALHRAHRLSLYADASARFCLLPPRAAARRLRLSCRAFPACTPYRIDIQQGNFVSQDMVAQLKPGMSKEQVRLALGTPLLTDIFHADRWDYVYWRERPRREARAAQARGVLRGRQARRASTATWRPPAPRNEQRIVKVADRRRRRPHGPRADRGGARRRASSSSPPRSTCPRARRSARRSGSRQGHLRRRRDRARPTC